MRTRLAALAAICATAAGIAATAGAATGPPPPKTYGGAKVSLFASGLKNPTSFAWGDGAMFAGDSGNSSSGLPNGGVYVIKGATATEIPNSPLFVGGVAFHKGSLYLSDAAIVNGAPGFQIARWSGWNGTTFTQRKVLYTAPKRFQGFNGIAFGPDGRLYVGVDLGLLNSNDHGPSNLSPYLYDILSMSASGKRLKVFASGIRQPWQMVFAPGSKSSFVSDLGQDGPKSVKNPPDFLLKVKQGDNFGFPQCNHTKGSKCKGFAQPFKSFAPHTDIMGLATLGKTLYMGSFLGAGGDSGGALFSMPIKGGKVSPVVAGFPLATDALAAHDGYLYVGGSTQSGAGVVYRVKP